MNRFFLLLSAVLLLLSCGKDSRHIDENDVTLKFRNTWNIYEKCELDEDENIVYNAVAWGGLVGSFLDRNMPADMSGYEAITFQFAEPLPVPVQIVVGNRFTTVGKKGLTSLTCNFDGQDVTAINEIVLQPQDSCSIVVKDVYLTPVHTTWKSVTIWSGECVFGDWSEGFVVKPGKFNTAKEGDKIEFIFKTDKSNPEIVYWLLRTIYDGTSSTLEGNDSELNEWGCLSIGGNATAYRIRLTANDIKNLRQNGLFSNGYYLNVSQVNLLHRQEAEVEDF